MARGGSKAPATEFGARLLQAIEASGKSETRIGRELGLAPGRMHRLLGKGQSPIASPGPEIIKALADHLGVCYSWLAIGRGPMRPDGAETPLDAASQIARVSGLREDAITAAVARYGADGAQLSAVDWILVFLAEARRLDREGVPHPDEILRRAKRIRESRTR